MDTVNILVVSRFGLHKDFFKELAATDPRISVRDAAARFVDEFRGSNVPSWLLDQMAKEAAIEVDKQAPGTREEAEKLLAQAEIIYAKGLIPKDLNRRAPKLKWLQHGGVGLEDTLLKSGLLENPRVTVTNSKGGVAIPIAEQAIAFMFMLAKNAPRLFNDKNNRQWGRFETLELRDRTVGIIGLGAIGSEAGRLAKSIGMKVIAIRRSTKKRETGVCGVDEMYPPSELHEMLSRSDFLVIAAPLTGETNKMIGERELRAMKPSSYLINISRGQIIDQPVLIQALKEGWIAGAGLDAFDSEPLPKDNELWGLPNVIMSPHMAGSSDKRSYHLLENFQENLRRYLSGKPLLNVIDKNTKY